LQLNIHGLRLCALCCDALCGLHVVVEVYMPEVGSTGKPLLFAACGDAVVKGNRYARAGRSSASAADSSAGDNMFLGAPHDQLWQMSAAGPLPLRMVFGDTGNGSDPMQTSPVAEGDDTALELDTHTCSTIAKCSYRVPGKHHSTTASAMSVAWLALCAATASPCLVA
jgi:hypothetical protein